MRFELGSTAHMVGGMNIRNGIGIDADGAGVIRLDSAPGPFPPSVITGNTTVDVDPSFRVTNARGWTGTTGRSRAIRLYLPNGVSCP
jgi:hypothetical protein